jgi:hypothetical protein
MLNAIRTPNFDGDTDNTDDSHDDSDDNNADDANDCDCEDTKAIASGIWMVAAVSDFGVQSFPAPDTCVPRVRRALQRSLSELQEWSA